MNYRQKQKALQQQQKKDFQEFLDNLEFPPEWKYACAYAWKYKYEKMEMERELIYTMKFCINYSKTFTTIRFYTV